MIDHTMFDEETWRRVEGAMTNNARRYLTWNWYAAALAGAPMPKWWDLREYGRDYALGLIWEGATIEDALAKATKAVYHYAYDDAKGAIKHAVNYDTRYVSMTSSTDTQEWSTSDRGVTPPTVPPYFDSHDDFVFDDYLERIETLTDDERVIIRLRDLNYSMREIGLELGVSRQTIHNRMNVIKKKVSAWVSQGDQESWQGLTL